MKIIKKKDNKDYFGLIFVITLVAAFLIGVAVITISLYLHDDLSWKKSLFGALVIVVLSFVAMAFNAITRR